MILVVHIFECNSKDKYELIKPHLTALFLNHSTVEEETSLNPSGLCPSQPIAFRTVQKDYIYIPLPLFVLNIFHSVHCIRRVCLHSTVFREESAKRAEDTEGQAEGLD